MESLFKHGSAANVSLSESELARLKERFGRRGAAEWIEELSLAKASKGIKTKSDFWTILAWHRKEKKRDLVEDDRCEALEDDPTPEMLESARERNKAEMRRRWEVDAAKHQHDHRCQYGAVCAYVESKRPK